MIIQKIQSKIKLLKYKQKETKSYITKNDFNKKLWENIIPITSENQSTIFIFYQYNGVYVHLKPWQYNVSI